MHPVFKILAGIEWRRTGEHRLAVEVMPGLDLVTVGRLDRETDVEGVAPQRLDRRVLDLGLETFEALGVGREFTQSDVGAIVAVELTGGEALHGGHGARRRQHGNAKFRHRLVDDVGEHDERLAARRTGRAGAPFDVFRRGQSGRAGQANNAQRRGGENRRFQATRAERTSRMNIRRHKHILPDISSF